MGTTTRPPMGGLARDAVARHSKELDQPPRRPGDLVSVAIRNLRERDPNPETRVHKASDRWRPAVFLDQDAEAIQVVGLTAKSTYREGNHRIALPDWEASGLRGPGWIYSPRPAFVPYDDVGRVIGHLTETDAKVVARAIIDAFGDHAHIRALVYPLMEAGT